MNSYRLKWIALLTMVVDHTAAVLVPPDHPVYMVMRCIGRIAFPIYVFLLIEGFRHTGNVKKYILRLGVFALVSEIPFDFAFYKRTLEFTHQNVFFTLFLGLCCIYLIDAAVKKFAGKPAVQILTGAAVTAVFCTLASLLRTDYAYGGILLIAAFYLFHDNKALMALCLLIIAGTIFGAVELPAVFAMLPIAFYNGEKGKSMKYFFYGFYPAHLLLLGAIFLLI